MLGLITTTENGRRYPITYLEPATYKSIESTKKSCKNIWDLAVVDKEGKLFLAMPDPLKKNYSFTRALEAGKHFEVEFQDYKSWDGKSITNKNLKTTHHIIINKEIKEQNA